MSPLASALPLCSRAPRRLQPWVARIVAPRLQALLDVVPSSGDVGSRSGFGGAGTLRVVITAAGPEDGMDCRFPQSNAAPGVVGVKAASRDIGVLIRVIRRV